MAECMMEHHAHGNKEKDAQLPETRHTGMHAPGYASLVATPYALVAWKAWNALLAQLVATRTLLYAGEPHPL